MGLPITSLYTGLSIFIALALIVWVVKGRQSEKVPLGDGGSREVMLRMRAQSNFVETALILLIALGLMEFHGMPRGSSICSALHWWFPERLIPLV